MKGKTGIVIVNALSSQFQGLFALRTGWPRVNEALEVQKGLEVSEFWICTLSWTGDPDIFVKAHLWVLVVSIYHGPIVVSCS